MKKCECGHPSSFHPKVEERQQSGMQKFAAGLERVFGGRPADARACMGELPSGKPCPCQRYTEDA